MQRVEYIVLHCTAGEWGTVESIRHEHMYVRRPPFADIGYRSVITNAYPTFDAWRERRPELEFDGKVWPGRDLDRDEDYDEEVGAHVRGWNHKSLGVAMVGKDVFSAEQIRAAARHCLDLAHRHEVPVEHVIGHYETGAPKSCPNIDMKWFRDLVRSVA